MYTYQKDSTVYSTDEYWGIYDSESTLICYVYTEMEARCVISHLNRG